MYSTQDMPNDISPFANEPDHKSSRIIKKVLRHESTGRAIVEFDKHKNQLSDYQYWFLLSTLWVSYCGFSDLRMWKRLFSSTRLNRKHCIMKPSEIAVLDDLSDIVMIYRAKRSGENDCIAYTLDKNIAAKFANDREEKLICQYTVNKNDILALFLRRGEQEVIVLDSSKPTLITTIPVIVY